jgi:hypothetical protein
MSGGLIQLVSSGMADSVLTTDPEITFFKKVYKRHTNFSLEIKEIMTDQQPDYGDKISFSLNNADLIHRCFIQVEIPTLTFNTTSIVNANFINWKNNLLKKISNEITKWTTLYTNLKNFVSIELLLYQQLLTLFLSDNITLNNIKEVVIKFNNVYKTQKNVYIPLIDHNILNLINITDYILSINLLLTYDATITNSNYISIYSIQNNIKNKYNKMNEYLNYYHSNLIENQKSYDNINTNNIKFAWTYYLGHYYFSQYELDIGGNIVEQYSSDQFHIYQLHHLKEEQITNYFSMIANIPDIYDYNNNTKPSKILLIPLVFWFCKSPGLSLPIVAMRNTSVIINLTINSLKNLLYFRDWESEWYELVNLTIPYTTINNNLNYISYDYNINNKKITYKLKNINNEALTYIYPNLVDADYQIILNNFGILENNNYVLYAKQWIIFKNNLKNYPNLLNKIGGYDSYIDYNYLLNLIPKPKIKLLAEFVFLDDVERSKFASTKLEYVIEGFQENIYDIQNYALFNGDLSIDRPNKYMKWFIQPKNFLNGITEYGKMTPYIFDYKNYYKNKIFDKQIITINQLELLQSQIDYSFYHITTAYQSLNRQLPDGVYFYNFSLYAEEVQPSGTANFSVLKEKRIRYEFNPDFLKEYFNSPLNPNNDGLQIKVMTINYNFFIVHQGMGRLVFGLT